MIKIEKLLAPMSMEQQIKFAIYCTKEVYDEREFIDWANNWLSGVDRTIESALECYKSTVLWSECIAKSKAAWTAAKAATEAVWAAVRGAEWLAELTAAWERTVMTGPEVAVAEDAAAEFVTEWNKYAEWAIVKSIIANPNIDLEKLAQKAMEE